MEIESNSFMILAPLTFDRILKGVKKKRRFKPNKKDIEQIVKNALDCGILSGVLKQEDGKYYLSKYLLLQICQFHYNFNNLFSYFQNNIIKYHNE